MGARRGDDSLPPAYLFGNSGTASRRLKVLADVFAESSRPFLSEATRERPCFAVDIGCGPGYTTRLAAEMLGPLRTVGIDSSEAFIEEARRSGGVRVSYMVHDAATIPFPVGPADLIYARFVATHLIDPEAVIDRWASQLVQGGLLLLDEVDSITTSNDVLSHYLDMVSSVLAHDGKTLCVGPALSEMRLTGLKTRADGVRRLRVQDRQAATMFRLNLETWRSHPFAAGTYGDGALRLLADELEAQGCVPGDESGIEWGMRQIVLERA